MKTNQNKKKYRGFRIYTHQIITTYSYVCQYISEVLTITNLMYVLLCFKNSLNHSLNPFFAQITKDIWFKLNHQMYP